MVGSFVWFQWTAVPRNVTRIELESPPNVPFALVVLDPGHGGQDSGTIKNSMVEKDLTLDVAHRVQRILQASGVAVALTRGDDTYVSLQDRAIMANKQPDSVFVSIHFDEGGRSAATGIETYYATHAITFPERVAAWLPFLSRTSSDPPNLESQSLAASIQESLVTRTQATNRGTRPQQFFVIANVRHPAVLVEGGFLSNKEDVLRLTNADYREQMA
ncbi:MAG TPA: N-acetylmuramoyl-L-alanine amidase, partial [Chthoniobacterales bacterium]|nr:N-acetylmuramoyl-L-alanine amidase [Chthoniobacterales bacterium]